MRLVALFTVLFAWAPLSLAQAPDLAGMDVVERSLPDGPVALVLGDAIEKDRYLALYHTELAAARMAGGDAEIPEEARVRIGIGCVTELIQRQILLQEAAKRKLSMSDAEVEAEFKEHMDRMKEDFKRRGQSEATEAEILERVHQTRADALAELRELTLVSRVRDALVKDNNVQISEKDMKDFYDKNPQIFRRGAQVHLRQIYVRPKPNARDANEKQWQAAEKRIQEALARIRAGETFAAVAKTASESNDKVNGGDMGAIPADQLPPFYVEAAKKLSPGAISDIIKSEHGYHIIQLESQSEGEGDITFDTAKERIAQVLKAKKAEDLVDTFCQPIAQDPAKVQIYLDLERAVESYLGRAKADPDKKN
ncbi:MAG: peptidylprolyl isomerase [Candidatus Hydrogenedentes bacterium]|nr:peptidylprolyl isomerase [Candidatus Hydrogenedentota bacterium]